MRRIELAAPIGAGQVLCGFHSSGAAAVSPFDGFIEGYLTKAK
jgi:hypothetical protein